MALLFKSLEVANVESLLPQRKARNGHAQRKSIANIRLDKPGRVRIGHLLTILGISHSTLYERISKGTCPKPDGKDTRPYWDTSTVMQLLSMQKTADAPS